MPALKHSLCTKDICCSWAEERMTAQCCSYAEKHLECTTTSERYEVRWEVFRHLDWAVLCPAAKCRSYWSSIDISATAIRFPWRLESTDLIDYGKHLRRRSLAWCTEAALSWQRKILNPFSQIFADSSQLILVEEDSTSRICKSSKRRKNCAKMLQ